MTVRAIVPKLRYALVGFTALAWMSHAGAVPDDRDARTPRWAITDLACAEPRAPLPGCRDQGAPARTASGEELVRGYVTRALASTAAARTSPPVPAPPKRPSQKASAKLPAAPVKVDDYPAIAHALREAVGALGRSAGAEILLAFVGRPVMAQDDGERLRRMREMPPTFPFATLLPFSASLSDVYRGEGARFNHVLFHAIDPERLIAWNVGAPESAAEGAAAARPRLWVGELGSNPAFATTPSLWGIPGSKPGQPDDGAAKQRRTFVYMERGRTSVMTVEDPAPK